MLKRVLCLFLIVLMANSSLTQLFYFAGYELNKEYIAAELCVNKDKPQLQCNGKCFLAKKIAEAEKKQQANERQTQKDLLQQVMLISEFKITFFGSIISPDYTPYKPQNPTQKHQSIFHPPQVVWLIKPASLITI